MITVQMIIQTADMGVSEVRRDARSRLADLGVCYEESYDEQWYVPPHHTERLQPLRSFCKTIGSPHRRPSGVVLHHTLSAGALCRHIWESLDGRHDDRN